VPVPVPQNTGRGSCPDGKQVKKASSRRPQHAEGAEVAFTMSATAFARIIGPCRARAVHCSGKREPAGTLILASPNPARELLSLLQESNPLTHHFAQSTRITLDKLTRKKNGIGKRMVSLTLEVHNSDLCHFDLYWLCIISHRKHHITSWRIFSGGQGCLHTGTREWLPQGLRPFLTPSTKTLGQSSTGEQQAPAFFRH
jgi:hypothetical protein